MARIALALLSFIISSPTLAGSFPACDEARLLPCPSTAPVGEYLRCMDQKKTLFLSCKEAMRSQLEAKRKTILDTIDSSAREAGIEVDSELSEVQFHLSELEKINRENEPRFKELGQRLADFIDVFEGQVRPQLQHFADRYREIGEEIDQASVSSRPEDRVELQRLEVALDKLGQEESNYVAAAGSRVILMRGEIEYFTDDYRVAMQSHRKFLEEKGHSGLVFDTAAYLKLVNRADLSLTSGAQSFADRRNQLADRLRIATTTLVELYVNKKTKEVMADVRHMKSAAEFLAQVNVAIGKAFVESSTSQAGVPLLAAKYQAMTAFIQFASICETQVKAAWMKEGCSFGTAKLAAARQTLKQMPSNIQLGLQLVQSKAPFLDERARRVKASLAQKDLAYAARLYDDLVREAFQ